MPLPKILALIVIVSMMLGAGLQVDWTRMRAIFGQLGLQARAALANFILVPLFAFLVVRYFNVTSDVVVGILLMAMAPGAPFLANVGGRKSGGSLSFALEIMFLFAVVSLITIPITAALILPPDAQAHAPASKFLTTLVLFQLIPLLIGALVGPRLSDNARSAMIRVLNLIFVLAALAVVIVVFAKIVHVFAATYGAGHLLIILTIALFSGIVGWLLGGPNREYRHTLTNGTMLRNIGLGLMIGTTSFADSLTVPAVVVYFIITFVLANLYNIVTKRISAREGTAPLPRGAHP